jgi:HEAT repeat protein
MRPLVRLLAAVALLPAALLAAPARPVSASTADLEFNGCAHEAGAGAGECQHFLRNPAGPTDDPCWCDKCRNGGPGQKHDGKTVPDGWNETLFTGGGMDAYLKRHSIAFGLVCSECLTSTKPWPDGTATDAGSVPDKDFAGRPARPTVLNRLAVESKLFKKPEDVVLAYNRHIYLVTDVDGMKVRTAGGSARVASRHEWLHLMIERAEFARREWVRNLGEPIVMRTSTQRPIAIYIPDRWRDFERIGATYFKNAGSRGLRGPVAELCDGMCLTGMSFSKEEGRDDHGCVVQLRHDLSHALLSTWGSLETRPKSLPAWFDEGLAHWLTKTQEGFRDDVFYCAPEGLGGPSRGGGGPAWPGKEWDKDVLRWVQTNKFGPFEALLGKNSLGELTEEDQKRAWSVLDFALTDWRKPFAKVLTDLRKEQNPREAFTKHLGCSPEIFDQRWRDRVAGKRETLAPTSADAAPESADAPGARDRKSLREEKDPKTLAAKLRALGEIKDPKTVPVVLDVIGQAPDLPRETAFVALLAVKDPACRDQIASYGLAHPDAMVRAYAARVCGRLRIESALPKLAALLEDRNWYARAEAAVACGTMRDTRALPVLRKLVTSDSSEKTRVGVMDALAMYEKDAVQAIPLVAKHLDSPQWQLRVTAAQTLGDMGSMEAVESLVTAMEKEPGGRVSDDLRTALRKITCDDLGRKPASWRTWWEKAKASSPSGLPARPDAPPKQVNEADEAKRTRDDVPVAFGIEIYSQRVGFVCDVSESMSELFTPDVLAAKALSREYTGSTKLGILKEEVVQALSQLDPRAHFSLVTFGTQIKSFRPNPIPASAGNVDSARGFLKSLAPSGETNYYDALKAALDLGERADSNEDFRSTPDTITFLTDGEPTQGEILDADVLVEWYTGLNRYARVRTHTITFGLTNVDTALLKAMADRNGGRFTLVAERKAPPGK